MKTQIKPLNIALTALLLGGVTLSLQGQSSDVDHTSHQQHTATASSSNDIQGQLTELLTKVNKIEAALAKNHTGMKMDGGMGKMKDKSMMPMMKGKGMMGGMMNMDMDMGSSDSSSDMQSMDMDSSDSGGMSMGKMGMMSGMKKKKMGMGMMKMKDMSMGMMGKGKMMGMMGSMDGSSAMQSPLPGFPGVSHLYHIGASNFFLDHQDHINLTTQQQTALAEAKEAAELKQATAERNIEQAEQELWELTAADKPDIGKIEKKVKAIEKLKSDQRLAFIRAVGDAAKTLTREQQQALVGQSASDENASADHSSH